MADASTLAAREARRAAGAALVARIFAPVSFGLAGLYLALTVTYLLEVPGMSPRSLAALTGVSSAALAVIAAWQRRGSLSAATLGALSAVVGAIALTNVSVHYSISGNPWHAYNFLLFNLAIGVFVVDRRWLVALLACSFAAWFATSMLADVDRVPWVGAVFYGTVITCLLSIMVHETIGRALGRAEIERRRANDRQHQAEQAYQNLRQIIDNTPDAVLIHRDGELVYANHAFLRALGRPWDDVVGSRLEELVGEAGGSAVVDLLHTDDADRQGVECPFTHADGSDIEFDFAPGRAIEFEGEPAVLLVAREVTYREEKLKAKFMLADRLAAVGTLAAGVAHEINNPLAYVMMNLDSLADLMARLEASDEERAEIDEMIADALDGADRVKSIVADLRGFSRVDSRPREAVDVRETLDSAVKMAGNAIRQRAQLIRSYDDVPPVTADPARLGQVVLNLVINACQAIPDGNAQENELEVSTRTDARGSAIIEIRDTGNGIPPEVQKQMFDPFYTTKPVGIGTGLGLYYCHNEVVELGGTLSFDTEIGVGSTFRIVLPACRSAGRRRAKRGSQTRTRIESLRILVIDDESHVGKSLVKRLRDHKVEIATSGRDGLARLEQDRFDLVLCDLIMPEVSGRDVFESVCKSRPDDAERFVFMSGGAFTPAMSDFAANVSNPVLQKPFDKGELEAVIRSFASDA